MRGIDKLLTLASDPLAPEVSHDALIKGGVPREVARLLAQRNGFYAFVSALHVRPFGLDVPGNVIEWNRADAWRGAYGDLVVPTLFFFAEDTFGGQFAWDGSGVVAFDPETGACERLAGDIEGWASAVMQDPSFRTAYPIAQAWQEANGALPHGRRLMPAVPFVCGGAFDLSNLAAIPDAEAMDLRGQIALQIRDLPDGAQIVIRVRDDD
jgi:hypothetical protein